MNILGLSFNKSLILLYREISIIFLFCLSSLNNPSYKYELFKIKLFLAFISLLVASL